VALFLYFKLKWDMLKVIGACAILGLLIEYFT